MEQGLTVVRTLGLLDQAAQRNLIDIPDVVEKLVKAKFRVDERTIADILTRDTERRNLQVFRELEPLQDKQTEQVSASSNNGLEQTKSVEERASHTLYEAVKDNPSKIHDALEECQRFLAENKKELVVSHELLTEMTSHAASHQITKEEFTELMVANTQDVSQTQKQDILHLQEPTQQSKIKVTL